MIKPAILSTSLGNVLEWYDFGLFIFLAPIIGEQFFPANDPVIATIAAFGVFAAGFLCRPLGGILFGHYGDTRGRAKTLRLSMLLIAFSTLLIGFLPTHQMIGLGAAVLFTLLRLTQGLSVGGEYSGVMIYLVESAPAGRRGFITSFAATGANVGFLLATLTVILLKTTLPAEALSEWGWRLPFIFIGLFGTIILCYRLKMSETPIYLHLKSTQHVVKKPFLSALTRAPKSLIKIFGLTCMSSTFYYVFFGYMPDYLNQFIGIPSSTALTIQSVLLVFMLFLVPLCGACGDFWGRKRMLMFTATGIILLSIPCFYLLQLGALCWIVISLSVALILSSLDQGNSLTAVVENCPVEVRYSGIAFSYNLGMALFGGTAPLVVSLLTQNVGPIAPAYYLIGMASVSFIAIMTLLNKSAVE